MGRARRRHHESNALCQSHGGSYESILAQICTITSGPVSAEVVAIDVEGMFAQARAFARIASNIVVKIPMSEEGLEVISRLAAEKIATNCTLVFSANQGLLAAKAGAKLAASLRHPLHVTQAALAGAHIATVPYHVLRQMVHHPLTDTGIVQFRKDWEQAQKQLAHASSLPDGGC